MPHAPAQNDPRRSALLTAWRTHHSTVSVRAGTPHPTIRQMIDPMDRTASIRQRLRQLLTSCPGLEAKVVGNAAKPVVHYRLRALEG